MVLSVHGTGDYVPGGPVDGNNAAPGIDALLHGDVVGYVTHQPMIGLTSILLRLPAVALAHAVGGGGLLSYQLGAIACMLPLALLGGWLVAAPGLTLDRRLFRLLAAFVVITSPILSGEVQAGHPEGTLAAALSVAAVIAAGRGRVGWSAALLGLAIATKEWALIAVPPVIIALPGRRRKVGVIAGAVVLLLCCAQWLADPSALLRAVHGEGHTRFLNPFSLLWPFGAAVPLPHGEETLARQIPWGLTRIGATALVCAAAAPLGVAWLVRARRRGATCDPLALLALLGLLRCLFDSTHLEYYMVAALIPLAAWEATENRPPLATLALSVMVSLLFNAVGKVPEVQIYVAWTVGGAAFTIYLARGAVQLPGQQPWPKLIARMLSRGHEFALDTSLGRGKR